MKHRFIYEWMKWREESVILCERIPISLKGKFKSIMVKHAMMYALKFKAVNKNIERRINSSVMRLSRWMSGMTV